MNKKKKETELSDELKNIYEDYCKECKNFGLDIWYDAETKTYISRCSTCFVTHHNDEGWLKV